MDSKQYAVAVLNTESKPEVIRFGTLSTHMILGLVYLTGELVDKAKKQMFYGKAFSTEDFIDQAEELQNILEQLKGAADSGSLIDPGDIADFDLEGDLGLLSLNNIDKRLLHVVLGVSSEASELADALRQAWETRQPIDRVNAAEEIGDHFWYLAVGADALGIPLDVLFEQNIAKLNDKKTGRYRKGGFNVNEAITRNLTAERANLAGTISDERALELANQFSSEKPLITTQSRHIYYDQISHEFIVFDEAGLEHTRQWSFAEAEEALKAYCDQLNGVPPSLPLAYGQAHLKSAAISATAHTGPVPTPQPLGTAPAGSAQVATMELRGPAPTLTEKAKGYASLALDKIDAGVDRAKDFLKK